MKQKKIEIVCHNISICQSLTVALSTQITTQAKKNVNRLRPNFNLIRYPNVFLLPNQPEEVNWGRNATIFTHNRIISCFFVYFFPKLYYNKHTKINYLRTKHNGLQNVSRWQLFFIVNVIEKKCFLKKCWDSYRLFVCLVVVL